MVLEQENTKKTKFKDERDEEIYNRNENIVKQSKRYKAYLKEQDKDAVEEVPNLLEDFKNRKRDNDVERVGDIIGSVISNDEATAGTHGK